MALAVAVDSRVTAANQAVVLGDAVEVVYVAGFTVAGIKQVIGDLDADAFCNDIAFVDDAVLHQVLTVLSGAARRPVVQDSVTERFAYLDTDRVLAGGLDGAGVQDAVVVSAIHAQSNCVLAAGVDYTPVFNVLVEVDHAQLNTASVLSSRVDDPSVHNVAFDACVFERVASYCVLTIYLDTGYAVCCNADYAVVNQIAVQADVLEHDATLNVSRCNAGVVPDHDVAVVDHVPDGVIYHSRLTNYCVRNVDAHGVVTIGVDVSVVNEAAADVAVC